MSAGKLARYDLIPPAALELVAEAFGRGAAKHDRALNVKGWGKRPADESYASLMRHLQAWRRGERIDPDDGQHHLAAVIVNALILMDNEQAQSPFSAPEAQYPGGRDFMLDN